MPLFQFFDANARIGTWINPRPEYATEPSELLEIMDAAGISAALVYHALAWQWDPVEGNRLLLDQIATSDRLFPCLVALPPATGEIDPDWIVDTCREAHGAVRVFPRDHNWRLTPWCAEDLLAALAGAGVPLLVELEQTSWDDIAASMQAFPTLPLVLLNTSYRLDRHLYPLWDRGYNIMVGTETYMPFLGVEDVCQRFGPERLVFSTGLPERDPGGPIALIQYAQIPAEQKQAIAGGNMRRLLGLE
ncbi:MAG: amidohydrolase family protein [Armatimonadetes bacterium]|nr:amidohydrolase family protein [Armatimonadota bacterium]